MIQIAKILLASFLIVSSSGALAQEKFSGTIYDLKSNQTKKLFTLTIDTSSSPEGTRVETFYKDPEGQVAVHEVGLVQGEQLKEYTVDRPQTGEKGSAQVRDGRVYFEYQDADGKKKTADEKIKGPILSPANFPAFIRANWEALEAGKVIPVRYVVWDRRETVGFEFQKMGDVEIDGRKAMEVRMKPSSFLIAAIIDPVHLWYLKDEKRLVLLKGAVSPKKKVNGKWDYLQAEVVYTKDQAPVSK